MIPNLLLIVIMLAASVAVAADRAETITPAQAEQKQNNAQEPIREPASGEEINWQVISAGGTEASSANFGLLGTVAQSAVGLSESPGFALCHGYWICVAGAGPDYVCGDADANGVVNVSDIVWMINFVFGDGPEPSPLQAGDVDCNGSVNVSDVVFLINFVFGTGYDPCDTDGDGVPDC
jgi:hypothetical protein